MKRAQSFLGAGFRSRRTVPLDPFDPARRHPRFAEDDLALLFPDKCAFRPTDLDSTREVNTMSSESDAKKQRAARAAVDHLLGSGLEHGAIIGVGTGSTVNFFIEALTGYRERIGGAVSSSNATTERLKGIGIEVLDLNEVDT